VARVAYALASVVNDRGGALDLALVQAAALVHDAAKPENNHAASAARLLVEMGFPAMAAIVEGHMDMDVSEMSPLDEAQIVYLADKLMEGDRLMRLSERYAMKLKKYDHDPRVAKNIRRRWRSAMTIQVKVEQTTGSTIEQILKEDEIVSANQRCATS
jgi:hypothetical protein